MNLCKFYRFREQERSDREWDNDLLCQASTSAVSSRLTRRLCIFLTALSTVVLTVGCQRLSPSLSLSTDKGVHDADERAVDSPDKTNPDKTNPRKTNPRKVSITVSAAASLQAVLTEIEPIFERRYPGIDIFYNWGGSGTLQRQIEQGAPADIFFSASPQQMMVLAEKGKVNARSPQTLLTNQLVLITPKGRPQDGPQDTPLSSFADLEHLPPAEQIAVGEFRSVPAGQYAQATLTYFQLLPKLQAQLVFFSNVRGVLAAVENGHAAAGLVYATDAQLSDRVKVVAIAPAEAHPPIRYPIAILQRSDHPEDAQQYVNFLSDPDIIAIFERYGFNRR